VNHVVIFNKRYSCDRADIIRLAKVKNPRLREVGCYFLTLFPDHASPENTVLHLLHKSDRYDLVWTCLHFEHTCMKDIEEIHSFLKKLSFFSGERDASLDLLDAFAQKLIILVPEVDKGIFY